MIGIKELTRIEIDSDEVLKAIGYKNRSRVPARTLSLVDDYVENAQHLLDPSYAYVIRGVQRVHGRWTYIEGDIVFESEIIARLLEKCSRVAIFVLTIGSNLEKIAAGLAQDGLVVKASMLEAVGSVAAEGLAEFVQAQISHVAGTYGLADSRRFSPGYCDWSVRQQRVLFKALEADSGGVQLTRSCLMIPRKSVSGIIGLGPRGVADAYNPCPTCPKRKNCQARR